MDRVRQYWVARLKYYYSCGAVGQSGDSQTCDELDNISFFLQFRNFGQNIAGYEYVYI